jgi:hypothetical protein
MAEAHLNGSLNLPSAEAVFRTVTAISGDTVAKLPDGETGERIGWIEALGPKLRASDDLVEETQSTGYKSTPVFRLKPGLSYDDFEFPDLGYASNALASYGTFCRLREEGAIAPGVRFQVSLPTVVAGVGPFITPAEMVAAEPAYARRLRLEVDQILEAIPSGDLALQWDLAIEMGVLEGVFPTYIQPRFEGVVTRVCELVRWVPEAVPLGCHLCYGDAQEVTGQGEGRHWKEPPDAALMVKLANAIMLGAGRRIDWFSMPVPIKRHDEQYFEPLADLALDAGTRVYLGLVHHQDGVDGAQRRIDVAKRYLIDFGVATECGMGRKPPELVPTLLAIQRQVIV